MTLSVDKELSVVNLHIDALEQTLVEFSQPKPRAELYAELAKANARRAVLEHQQENATQWEAEKQDVPEAHEYDVSSYEPVESAEVLTFAEAGETDPVEYDDDPDLPAVADEEVSASVDENHGNFEVTEENNDFPEGAPANESYDDLDAVLERARQAD